MSWGDNEFGRGTAGRAIRSRKPAIASDLLNNPDFAPWRGVLAQRDYHSALAVPLIVSGEPFGVLLMYASEPDAFDPSEINLLEELGRNISYGITALRSKKERDEAVRALEAARNELEERVALRTQELVAARDAAEAADRLKSAFLAVMSHELRTPLNSIIGFTGIILQGLTGEITNEQRKQLGMVNESARHLLALINDVLDISKIEAGQLELRKEYFPLHRSIEKAVDVIRPQAQKKSLAVTIDIPPSVGTVYGDVRRVEQVLINLLSNAVKFTDAGGVSVSVESHGDSVWISIRDTGIGITPEDKEKLFQPFRQIDAGPNRRHEGTGLGLSICKRLAVLLGGDVWAESEGPGRGSTFTFSLPKGAPVDGEYSGH